MLSSSFTESISFTWNSESSSLGSCSDTKVVGCRISNSDVHAQAHFSGHNGCPSLRNRAEDDKLQDLGSHDSAVEAPHTRKRRIRESEEHRRSGQGVRGSNWLETNFIYNVDSRAGNNQEVYRSVTFFSC